MRPTRLLIGCRCQVWSAVAAAAVGLTATAWGDGRSSLGDQGGLTTMPGAPKSDSILAGYYDDLLRDHDVERFRDDVRSRYNEATLARLLAGGDAKARRASALALGLVGTFQASNAALARAFGDPDPTVRELAHEGAWALWYRADSDENNARLAEIRRRIGRGDLDEAVERANRLVADAPKFAEAYNQRAIAHFFAGRFEESAADCRRVLELNPYHFGALSGQGQCLLRLNKPAEAAAVFRKALELQPFDDGLRAVVAELDDR